MAKIESMQVEDSREIEIVIDSIVISRITCFRFNSYDELLPWKWDLVIVVIFGLGLHKTHNNKNPYISKENFDVFRVIMRWVVIITLCPLPSNVAKTRCGFSTNNWY